MVIQNTLIVFLDDFLKWSMPKVLQKFKKSSFIKDGKNIEKKCAQPISRESGTHHYCTYLLYPQILETA